MPEKAIAEHYAQLIGLVRPWKVSRVEVSHSDQEVQIFVVRAARPRLRCPECDRPCGGYDTRERRWRHLDTMQYRTFVIAEVPRVRCEEHGVRQVAVPWSDPGSRFTALFEGLVIDWLGEANVRAIARRLRLSWDQVAGIIEKDTTGITKRMAWFSLFGKIPADRGGSPLRDEKVFAFDKRVQKLITDTYKFLYSVQVINVDKAPKGAINDSIAQIGRAHV